MDYFDNKSKIQGRNNVIEVVEATRNREEWVLKKVRSHLNRFGLDAEEFDTILSLIIENKLFASMFAKKPNNQNISESTQLSYLKSKGFDVQNLGNDSLRYKGLDKSIDFIYNDFNVIAKVCNSRGGHQDNVVLEIEHAIDFLSNNLMDKKFIFLLDGTRFDDQTIKELNEKSSERIILTNCDKFI